MRTRRVFGIAAAACLLLGAGSLQAQTASGQMQWRGVNGTTGKYNQSGTGGYDWYVYTSPYFAGFQINPNPAPAMLPPAGTTGFGPTTDIYCVDFEHYANTGTSTVWFTNLADAQSNSSWLGTYTRNSSLQNYLAAAYLAQRIQADPSHSGLYNGAIWYLMSGAAAEPSYWLNGSTWTDVTSTALDALNNHTGDVNAASWVVVSEYATDATGKRVLGSHQEYITQVTPEPATLLLLGTGLVVMLLAAGAFRRRLA